MAPRFQPATGTLVVIAAGRSATSLPSLSLMLRAHGASWVQAGNVSGTVPAAPDQPAILLPGIPPGGVVRFSDIVGEEIGRAHV